MKTLPNSSPWPRERAARLNIRSFSPRCLNIRTCSLRGRPATDIAEAFASGVGSRIPGSRSQDPRLSSCFEHHAQIMSGRLPPQLRIPERHQSVTEPNPAAAQRGHPGALEVRNRRPAERGPAPPGTRGRRTASSGRRPRSCAAWPAGRPVRAEPDKSYVNVIKFL